jgi:hypothetical protein
MPDRVDANKLFAHKPELIHVTDCLHYLVLDIVIQNQIIEAMEHIVCIKLVIYLDKVLEENQLDAFLCHKHLFVVH